jgi:hypothetical protein
MSATASGYMYGIAIPPAPTGKYALVAGMRPVAVRADDWNELQLKADRMQGAEVRAKLADGTEVVIGKVDYTRVERVWENNLSMHMFGGVASSD